MATDTRYRKSGPAVFTSHFRYRMKQRGITWGEIGKCLCATPVIEIRNGVKCETFRAGGVEVVKGEDGTFVTCCVLKGKAQRNNALTQRRRCRQARVGVKLKRRRLAEEEE